MFISVHNSAILVSSALTTRLLGVWDVSKEAFLLGMFDIYYSSIDSSSSYIICTPMKMKEYRLYLVTQCLEYMYITTGLIQVPQ